MDKNIILSVIKDYQNSKYISSEMKVAIDFFLEGIDEIKVENYDNPFIFVEDVYCALEDPTERDLSDFDAKVIDCMNFIAHDIHDLL